MVPLVCTFDSKLLSCDWQVTQPMTGQVTRYWSGQQKLCPCSLYVVKELRTAERLTCQSSSPRALQTQGSFPSNHPTREKYPSLNDTTMKKWQESFIWTFPFARVFYLHVHKHLGQNWKYVLKNENMFFLANVNARQFIIFHPKIQTDITASNGVTKGLTFYLVKVRERLCLA